METKIMPGSYITDPSILSRLQAVSAAASTGVAAITKGLPPGVAAAVTSAQVLATTVASGSIGSLGRGDVTGLLAQAKSAVGQATNVISVDKGIGQFGLQPTQLEAAGFLKPGTVATLKAQAPTTPTAADIAESQRITSEGGSITPEQVAQNRSINQALSAPTAWTGKAGINGIGNLLGSDKLQSAAQQGLMNSSLQGMLASGIATGKESAAVLSGLVQSATRLGVGQLQGFIKGIAPPAIAGQIAATIKGAQFSTDFVTQRLGNFTNFAAKAQSAVATVDRSSVDEGVKKLVGDAKIPAPQFKPAERQPEDPAVLGIKDEAQALVEEILTFLDSVKKLADVAIAEAIRLNSQRPVTEAQIAQFEVLRERYRTRFNDNFKSTYLPKLESLKTSKFDPVREYADNAYATLVRIVQLLRAISDSQKALIAQWRADAAAST